MSKIQEYFQTKEEKRLTREEPKDEYVCPHCDGTGIFVSRAGREDEVEKKCVCQIDEE